MIRLRVHGGPGRNGHVSAFRGVHRCGRLACRLLQRSWLLGHPCWSPRLQGRCPLGGARHRAHDGPHRRVRHVHGDLHHAVHALDALRCCRCSTQGWHRCGLHFYLPGGFRCGHRDGLHGQGVRPAHPARRVRHVPGGFRRHAIRCDLPHGSHRDLRRVDRLRGAHALPHWLIRCARLGGHHVGPRVQPHGLRCGARRCGLRAVCHLFCQRRLAPLLGRCPRTGFSASQRNRRSLPVQPPVRRQLGAQVWPWRQGPLVWPGPSAQARRATHP